MKRTVTLLVTAFMLLSGLATLVPALAGPTPQATTQRTVLIELFTGAACGPCVNVDHALDQIGDDYTRDQIAILVYHRPIPGPDTLQTTETGNRHAWYVSSGGQTTPNFWVDGKILRAVGFSTAADGVTWFTNAYNSRKDIGSQLSIDLDALIYQGSKKGDVWVNVTALENPSLANLVLQVVVYRKDYGPYNGGNGITQHRMAVRDMLPNDQGTGITPSPGSPYSGHFTFDLSADACTDASEMGVVAFVQTANRAVDAQNQRYMAEVLQSKDASLRVLPNRVPVLSDAMVTPTDVTEDEYATFGVNYTDGDGVAPKESKVIFRNGTGGALVEHGLDPKLGDWANGRKLEYTTKLSPGTYFFRFSASDAFGTAQTDWSTQQLVVRPRNNRPTLQSPNFAPLNGDTTTRFRYDIMYRDMDNEAPATAKIHIDTIPHDMLTDSPAGPFNDWVTYYYEGTMNVGDTHKFYYTFSDGKDPVRFPIDTASPNWIRGPEVLAPNEAPTLTTELFSPTTGTRKTDFTFAVVYTDGENDRPTISYIYVDGVAQLMTPAGSSFVSGARFDYTTRLGLGTHSYRFSFSDGKHEVRYPVAGDFEGPTVTNMGPRALIASPENDTRYTPTDYIPFSAVGSTDPENDVLTFKWTSDRDGDLNDLDAFDQRLSAGWHNVTLTVTDAHGATATAVVRLNVRPYLPHAIIKDLRTNVERPIETDPVRITVALGNDGEARADAVDVTILVDGTEVYSSTESIAIGGTREVAFTWTSVKGEHTIRAEISGDSEEKDILVDANKLPLADPIVYNPGGEVVRYKPGDEIFFRAQASDLNTGDTLTYEWDFGDGTPKLTIRDPSHRYTAAGAYSVTVKITDSRGGVTTKSLLVTIERPKEKSPGFDAALATVVLLGGALAVAGIARRRRT